MTKRKLTKYEDDVRRNLRNPAEINPAQSPHNGIHTCSKGCKKQGCNRGLRDTIEEQDAQIVALKQDLLEKTAAVRNLQMGGQCEKISRLKAEAVNLKEVIAELRISAEVERLKESLNKMINTPAEADGVEVSVSFWTKYGSRLPSSYKIFWMTGAKEGKSV